MDTTTLNEAVYNVVKLDRPMKIDANWDKEQWKKVKTISIKKHMGDLPKFQPVVEAKMMYDDSNVFVIFRVKDRFVQSTVQEYNGSVSENSCVEFFFSPDSSYPLKYFNLEVNAGGTPLIFHISKPWNDFKKLDSEDIKKIEIAHSLPSKVDPEITEPVTWVIEYRVPFDMLKKYSVITKPGPGVIWKGNFYKTGSKTSNPNYMTWSFVDNPTPDFHLPQFFGTLKFQ
ncbi:MAG TPA: carbohydrate-binding family 9-like protein [Flavitalea sp.]|nr:carbohydrate-binding family 9-like protein [Flavitalea sp.]